MDLWVRSQDRTKLMNTDSLVISKDKDTFYICDSLEGNIAEYKTKERAIEILDEIQDELISSDFMPIEKNEEVVLTCGSAKIYEMPEN